MEAGVPDDLERRYAGLVEAPSTATFLRSVSRPCLLLTAPPTFASHECQGFPGWGVCGRHGFASRSSQRIAPLLKTEAAHQRVTHDSSSRPRRGGGPTRAPDGWTSRSRAHLCSGGVSRETLTRPPVTPLRRTPVEALNSTSCSSAIEIRLVAPQSPPRAGIGATSVSGTSPELATALRTRGWQPRLNPTP